MRISVFFLFSVFMWHLQGNYVVWIRQHVVQFIQISEKLFRDLVQFERTMLNNVSLIYRIDY